MGIFNFFGSILGYLLWFLYSIFQNYGLAIIFFTIILKVLMFPMSLKQQKSMAGQAKLTEKQKELQKIYGNNKTKYNEELQKLYEKEGVNPASGCLTTLIQFPIMFGIYYSVIYPLQNTLHIASDKIAQATEVATKILNIEAGSTRYFELEIIKNWDALKDSMTMFSDTDVSKIESFVKGFEFLGLDLLNSPNNAGFMEFLWLIPVLSLAASFFMQFYMSKTTSTQQQGCMKYMMYALPFLSAYWAYIFPAAVGFYWVTSSVFSGVQSVITSKYFSPSHLASQNEAANFVTLLENEKKIKPLPANLQKQIADKIAAQNNSGFVPAKQTKSEDKKKKNSKSSGKSSGDYLGNKK